MRSHTLILKFALLLAAAEASAAEQAPAPVLAPRRIISAPAPAAQLAIATTQATPALIASSNLSTPPANPAPPKPGFTLADLKAQFPQNKDGHFQMELPAILNTSTDREVQALLEGQSLETTGQVMAEVVENADGTSLRITRSQMLCCSTHARECSVALKFSEKAPAFKDMAWVKLIGSVSYKREGLKIVPVVLVKEIKETPAPKNALLQ